MLVFKGDIDKMSQVGLLLQQGFPTAKVRCQQGGFSCSLLPWPLFSPCVFT